MDVLFLRQVGECVHEIHGHSVYAMSFSDIEEAMLQVQGAYLRLAVSQPPTVPLNEILFRLSYNLKTRLVST